MATRDIGPYNAYTPDSWNDEVLVGEEVGTPEKVMRSLVEEEGRKDEFVGQSGLMDTAGLRRRTDADEKNDTKSLQRSLERTLYLLVRSRKEGERDQWTFPTGDLEGKEGLHHVSEKLLETMSLWRLDANNKCADCSTSPGYYMRTQHEYLVCCQTPHRPLCQGKICSRLVVITLNIKRIILSIIAARLVLFL